MILRPATTDDAQLLFDWRNDPVTRAASHNVGELKYSDHVAWLRRSLSMPNRSILIALVNDIPVGTVRLDRSDETTELSWTVAPEHRNRGYGRTMVGLAMNDISGPIRAEIKVGNIASIRIAQTVGMRAVETRDGILHFAHP
jgi:RimJ/RimL family protein N-acetyltransferase